MWRSQQKVDFMLENYLCIRSLCHCNCWKLIKIERLYAVFRDSQQNLCFEEILNNSLPRLQAHLSHTVVLGGSKLLNN